MFIIIYCLHLEDLIKFLLSTQLRKILIFLNAGFCWTRHLIPLASRLVTFATLVNRLDVNRLAVNRLAILVNLPILALFTRQVTRQFTPMQFTPKV